VHFLRPLLRHWSLNLVLLVAALALVAPRAVHAEALLVVELTPARSPADNATMPWYPASVTKIMTAYVALKPSRRTPDAREPADGLAGGASQSPSKMGFRPGMQVTVENAHGDDDVKSANDMAVCSPKASRFNRRLFGDHEPDRTKSSA